jgi:hypothetical protein
VTAPEPTLELTSEALGRLRALAPIGSESPAVEPNGPRHVDAICFLSLGREGAVRELSDGEAVYRLVRLTQNLDHVPQGGLEAVSELVGRVPCLELQSDHYDPLLARLGHLMRGLAV